jgi:hypothetical protein
MQVLDSMQALLTGRVRVRPHDVWACIRHIHLRIRFNKYIESLLWNQVGDWECGRDPGPAVLGGGRVVSIPVDPTGEWRFHVKSSHIAAKPIVRNRNETRHSDWRKSIEKPAPAARPL